MNINQPITRSQNFLTLFASTSRFILSFIIKEKAKSYKYKINNNQLVEAAKKRL